MSAAQDAPMATLTFFADNLKPSAVSEILHIKPTATTIKGQPLGRKEGVPRAEARTGSWFITTEAQDVGDKPADHLAWVLGLAVSHIAELRRQDPKIKVDFSLLVSGEKFDLQDPPTELLKVAVLLGELEIEVPEKGMDIFLNRRNLPSRLRKEGPVKPVKQI
jgi:Domain of unknown function (DUF4279)